MKKISLGRAVTAGESAGDVSVTTPGSIWTNRKLIWPASIALGIGLVALAVFSFATPSSSTELDGYYDWIAVDPGNGEPVTWRLALYVPVAVADVDAERIDFPDSGMPEPLRFSGAKFGQEVADVELAFGLNRINGQPAAGAVDDSDFVIWEWDPDFPLTLQGETLADWEADMNYLRGKWGTGAGVSLAGTFTWGADSYTVTFYELHPQDGS